MKEEDEPINLELQKLKQSVLDVSQWKTSQIKQPYSFHKMLQAKMNNKGLVSFDSNKQIDVLEASEYLKLLCHQKKYLSKRRADKLNQLNESLHLEQQDYKYLFMALTQANYFKLEYPGYYEKLLQQIPKYPKGMFNSIEKDIHRTLMNDHPFQGCLRNVLTAFAIRNPNLLYCQGMNYVVAYFLINSVSEQQTFWILVCLVQNILTDDFYKDLTTISIATQIFTDVLPYIFAEMAKQMKQVGIDCSLFVVSWFVCLFTKGFINSVSSYLLAKLIIQRRNHSLGFLLLKFSLGIVAAILGRDEPFTFRRQFGAFRDKFQLSVFEISLLQIKLGIQYVELNEENYLKLQKHYRQKRQQRHVQNLQRDMRMKRFTLPVCSVEYPICLHRVEIERKIGNVEEVLITKNAYSIEEQYIEDYFSEEPRKETSSISYTSIDDCLMYRHQHICDTELISSNGELNIEKKLMSRFQLKDDQAFKEETEKIQKMQDGSSSLERRSSYMKSDSKFIELSGFFVVDDKFKFGDEDVLEPDNDEEENGPNQKKIPSMVLVEEPFNLEKQLKKHNIEQDWNKKEDDFKTLEEIKHKEEMQSNSINKNMRQLKIEDRPLNQNQLGQKICEKSHQSNSIEANDKFFSRQKIWNFLGRTWRKVVKIKEEQLNN